MDRFPPRPGRCIRPAPRAFDPDDAPTTPPRPMRLAFLSALLAAGPALAQGADVPLLVPGADDLAVDALAFEDRTFAVRSAAGQTIGTVTQTAEEDGEYVTVVTRVDIPQFDQAATDSVRILRASLAPQRASTTGDDGRRAVVAFDALRAVGTYGPAGRELPLDVALKTPAFHTGTTSVAGGAALVARALPFRPGYRATLETFSATQRLREVTLAVTGREDVERLDGSMASSWVVTETTSGRGGGTRRYYVDPGTRDLLRVASGQAGNEVTVAPADPEALAAEAAARAAVPRLRPGDAALDASRVRTGETVSTLNLLEPMAQPDIGTQTQRVVLDEAAGTLTLVSVVEVPMQNLVQTDSVVVAYPSLRPVSQTFGMGPVAIDLAYGDDAVTGSADLPGGAEDVDEPLADGPVFASSALGLVVQALPLADGYRAVLETYAAGGGLLPVAVEVTGPAGSPAAYTVTATPEGAPPTTYTVDAETREILATRSSPQQGVTIEVAPER